MDERAFKKEYTLRPAAAGDAKFLLELYGATHGRELANLPLPPEQIAMLLAMQYEAQQRSFEQEHGDSRHSIVMREGEAAGRIWIAEKDNEVRVVDIAVHPRYQGNGLGSQLMREVIGEARRSGKPLRLAVRQTNEAARKLYRKLGFVVTSQNEMHVSMERKPE